MSEHYIEKCPCGFVIRQCRCAIGLGEAKTVRIVPCDHPVRPIDETPTPSALTREQVLTEHDMEEMAQAFGYDLRWVGFCRKVKALRATIERQAQEIELHGRQAVDLFARTQELQQQLATAQTRIRELEGEA